MNENENKLRKTLFHPNTFVCWPNTTRTFSTTYTSTRFFNLFFNCSKGRDNYFFRFHWTFSL